MHVTAPRDTSLFSDLDVDAVVDAPLGTTTWIGVGGRADLLVSPRSVEALETLVSRCSREGLPLRVLGSGANLLVADEGVSGIVVKLDQPAFREVGPNKDGVETRLRAMGGADMMRTLMDATKRGLAGLEMMAGIPASIGGAVRMNAGGAYGCIGDAIESIVCITDQGRRVTYPRDQVRFDYRTSNLHDPIVLAAIFNVEPADPIALRDRVKEIFAYKKGTQPLGAASAGCAFRNPYDPVTEERVSAGRLIDEAGLKGLAIGGASVSERHGNFIVTEPGASATDVIGLLDEVARRVFEHCGMTLEREVVVWNRGEGE